MADSVRRQILNALVLKLQGISAVGKRRVHRRLLDPSQVGGHPSLCIWATEDDKAVENTRHKGGLMRVHVVGYESGGDIMGKIEALAKLVEDAIEADPGLGVDGVDSRGGISGARVDSIFTTSLGLDGESATEDYLSLEILIPYRHLVAVA